MPSILKDALKVTSENIEKTLQKTLEAAYQFTGTYVCCVLLQRLALTSITCVLHSPSLLPLSPLSLSLSLLFSLSSLPLLSLLSLPPLKGVLCSLTESPHPPPPPSSVLSLKEGLINLRQHETFIRTLMVHYTHGYKRGDARVYLNLANLKM